MLQCCVCVCVIVQNNLTHTRAHVTKTLSQIFAPLVTFVGPTAQLIMKAFVLATILLGLSAQAFAAKADILEEKSELLESEGRFLYYNGSSTAAAITLLGALILLGVIAYLIYVGGVLSTQGSSGYNRNDYQQGNYEAYGDQNYAQYR